MIVCQTFFSADSSRERFESIWSKLVLIDWLRKHEHASCNQPQCVVTLESECKSLRSKRERGWIWWREQGCPNSVRWRIDTHDIASYQQDPDITIATPRLSIDQSSIVKMTSPWRLIHSLPMNWGIQTRIRKNTTQFAKKDWALEVWVSQTKNSELFNARLI